MCYGMGREEFLVCFIFPSLICNQQIGRDTRTSTQSRRLVRRKGAGWSLNWPSGANLLAHLQLKCILYVPLRLLCTCLSLFLGRVLTRLDSRLD